MRLNDGQVSMALKSDFEAFEKLKSAHGKVMSESGVFWNWPSALTLSRSSVARILHLDMIYRRILGVPGQICEFGTHFGTSASMLLSLRSIYEPLNQGRVLNIFDTFEGFSGVSANDGESQDGDFGLPRNYEVLLEEVLALQASLNPNPHIPSFSIHRGDASLTVANWVQDNPHAIVALAIFDMDVYKPTLDAFTAIQPLLTKGSVLVFDELGHPNFPGETAALRDALGISGVKLQRDPFVPYAAWAIYEG
jgi:hypothetical protein